MTNKPGPKDAARLLKALRQQKQREERPEIENTLTPEMALLRNWQVSRLKETHTDLLENPRYRPAGVFFLNDIYAARDFSQRDDDLERMHNFSRKIFPESLIRPLTLAVELNTFTQYLDEVLLDVLINQCHLTDTLTPEMYAKAYRLCDNYDERVDQIALVLEVGQEIDKLTRLPLVGMTLRLARGPAHRAGWRELQDFLERGFAAFKHLKGAEKFLTTLTNRERKVLDQIYANHPTPFQLD